jgi:Xaa-Pro aminopeptidase
MTDILIVGDTERSPELRHEIPLHIGDEFLYAETGGRRVTVIWSVEGDRVAKIDQTIEIIASETFPPDDLIRDGVDIYDLGPALAARMVASLGITSAKVPAAFPLRVADELRRNGVELVVDQRLFDDRRRRKTPAELAGIRVASRAVSASIEEISGLLARSEPGAEGRVVDGEALTSELLKAKASAVLATHGCRGDDMIVAVGPQSADGHDQGSGRIANDDVVLCDVFPRHLESACYSDMSRTFLVGEPDPELVEWHAQCVEALELSRALVRPGANGADLHRAVSTFFEERGHRTALSKAEGEVLREGYNHALGHGVGLDVHEAPSLGKVGHDFVAGDVITLEPGLYRHGFGGIRVEDLVVVTADGCETLTHFPLGFSPVVQTQP